VRVIERVENRNEIARARSGAAPRTLQQLAERHPIDDGIAYQTSPSPSPHEVNREDIGVLEPGGCPGLALEPLDHAGRPGDVGPQHLHRQPAL